MKTVSGSERSHDTKRAKGHELLSFSKDYTRRVVASHKKSEVPLATRRTGRTRAPRGRYVRTALPSDGHW